MSFRSVSLVGALVICAGAWAAWAVESDHVEHEQTSIRITNGRLHPEVARSKVTDALSWLNYSSRTARVSFDKSVATKLKCTHKPSFQLDGDRLISPKIEGLQFASLCQLDPGEYDYHVVLYTGQGPIPDREFEGKLIIEQ